MFLALKINKQTMGISPHDNNINCVVLKMQRNESKRNYERDSNSFLLA